MENRKNIQDNSNFKKKSGEKKRNWLTRTQGIKKREKKDVRLLSYQPSNTIAVVCLIQTNVVTCVKPVQMWVRP